MSGLLFYRNFPTSGKNPGISEMSTVQKPHGRHNGRHGFFSMISNRLRGRKGHVYRSSEKRSKLFLGSCSRRPCFRNPYFSELPAYKMDSSSMVSSTRHNILHGSELNYFTKGRCFVLFIWLFGAVSFMGTVRS